MPRQARHAPGGIIYHILNRAAGRMELFRHEGDYAAFVRTLAETIERIPMRVCGYCLMPNHWHLALWPQREGDLSRFMQRLTITHVRRWVEHRHRVGMGSVYQGRYKSFPVEDDQHFTTMLRYIERNPLRAGLVKKAERWPWSSATIVRATDAPPIALGPWPVTRRADWLEWVNAPQTPAEEEAVHRAIRFSRPFGSPVWVEKMEKRLGLPPLRPRGRPRKGTEGQ
jgi:putative transposase